MVQTMLGSPRSQVSAQAQPLTNWVFDLATMNRGWEKLNGIDYTASYDTDLGDFGAINTGIAGTYYLQRLLALDPNSPAVDAFHQTYTPIGGVPQAGVETTPRLVYRARLGWSNGPFSATGFVNYRSHWFHNNGGPSNVNNECITTGGTVGGGSLPCAIFG